MDLYAGTSGWSYAEWKGKFYPAKFSTGRMLPFYSGHFRAVEVNYTFRSKPTVAQLEGWAEQVPAEFRFALKAPEQLTHKQRLQNADAVLAPWWEVVSALKDRLGPVLFQLPPYFQKDAVRLRGALTALPLSCRAAFEFRHPSWYDDEVFKMLREHQAALCVADTGSERDPPLVATADWGYLRLRQTSYGEAELGAWLKRLKEQKWNDVFVFFRHEDEAQGPQLATQLLGLAA